MAQNVARLGVVLGLDTAEFEQALGSAKSKVLELANKLPEMALAGVAALTAMAANALRFSDQISDLSDATGISIAKILQLSDALEMSGGHFDDANKVIEKFAQNIDTAAQGSKPLQDAFKRIGVGLQDLKSMSTEDLLKKTTEGIAAMGDKASQTGEKVALFGKAMKGVDMTAFNEELKKSSDEYSKYQDAIATTADMHDKLAKKTMMLTLSFTQNLMPTISAMLDEWTQKGGAADKVFEYLRAGLLGLWYAAGSVANGFAVMGVYWDKFIGNIDAQKAQEELRKIYADQIMFRGKLQALDREPEIKKAKKPDEINRDVTAAKDTEAEKQKLMLYTASLISKEYQRQVDFSLQQLKIRNDMVGMTTNERRVQEAINQQLDSTSKKIDEIKKQQEAAAGRNADPKVIAEYDKQIQKIKEIGEAAAKTAAEIETSSIQTQRTFNYGWSKAFNQYKEDAYNNAKLAEDMFSSMTGSMNSAIDTFVTTGKASFKDFALSIIQDIEKIIIKAYIMRAITGMAGMFSGGGSANIIDNSTAWSPKAEGGPVSAGSPYLVGENGPELIIPSHSSTVIPNHQLSDVMGGGGGVTYNGPYIANMSAIDTQSAMQFIAKNQNSIWAANQSAQRSLPQSR